ncbi:DUF1150 family protein [Rhodobacteraceae bacterium 2CG4]|uniref:DUF1150 family protein n=1 Tax=Halovulum marinum TaxID=2662447 RepID=A0A6L5Z133_9RHOB|nr:DUF1150 family protein [Halovulum marinum]MSU89684.1 DUF1150 family protein [Halovulum marinum]
MANYPYMTPGDDRQIAYVRRVDPETLPVEIRDQTRGMAEIYSINGADGQVLALVDDREKAFIVARMNEMQPVSVH